MRCIQAHITYITSKINSIDSMINYLIASDPNYENAVQLFCTIPSAKHNSTISFIYKNWYQYISIPFPQHQFCLTGLASSYNDSANKKIILILEPNRRLAFFYHIHYILLSLDSLHKLFSSFISNHHIAVQAYTNILLII